MHHIDLSKALYYKGVNQDVYKITFVEKTLDNVVVTTRKNGLETHVASYAKSVALSLYQRCVDNGARRSIMVTHIPATF